MGCETRDFKRAHIKSWPAPAPRGLELTQKTQQPAPRKGFSRVPERPPTVSEIDAAGTKSTLCEGELANHEFRSLVSRDADALKAGGRDLLHGKARVDFREAPRA